MGKKIGKKRYASSRPVFQALRRRLNNPDVLCLQALGATDNFELNLLAFLKRTEAVALDGRMVHEDIFSVRAAQKTKTLRVVKPLHSTLFHNIFPCC